MESIHNKHSAFSFARSISFDLLRSIPLFHRFARKNNILTSLILISILWWHGSRVVQSQNIDALIRDYQTQKTYASSFVFCFGGAPLKDCLLLRLARSLSARYLKEGSSNTAYPCPNHGDVCLQVCSSAYPFVK